MTTKGQLVIVASCTMRKKGDIPKALRFRRYARSSNGMRRVDAWRKALQTYDADTFPAARLYAGAFWSVVSELPTIARGRGISATLFIASAGYGLVSADAELKPYSATFSPGPDSVVAHPLNRDSRGRSLRDWWRQLSSWNGPRGHHGPRRLEQIAKRRPGASMLVIASPVYVKAIADDLLRTAQALRRPESLVIVSSVSGFPDELTEHLVPSVARLQARLGGTLGSLHARTARHLLKEAPLPLDAVSLRAKYERIASRVKPLESISRERRSDSEVRTFIRSHLKNAPKSCTALLRVYRDSGFRCEQRRFRTLFLQVCQS
jgi:hypothetical protein